MKKQTLILPQGEIIEKLPSIQFSEDNTYRFCKDFGFFRNVPSNVKFYPVEVTNNGLITFIGDGYGVSKTHTDKHGIVGKYGNGNISIFTEDIPHLVEWCTENSLGR